VVVDFLAAREGFLVVGSVQDSLLELLEMAEAGVEVGGAAQVMPCIEIVGFDRWALKKSKK
jgi:hypothetical protein